MFLAIEEGHHIGKPGLTVLKVRAFRFEPIERRKKQPGILDIDGEVVPFGPLEAGVLPKGLRVLAI